MNNSQKGFVVPLLIVIVVMVIGGSIYYFSQKNTVSSVSSLVKYDEQRIDDLQTLKTQIVNYWQANGKLPITLENLSNDFAVSKVPKDPKTGSSYFYGVENSTVRNLPTFKLCANFDLTDNVDKNRPVDLLDIIGDEHWNHNQGYQCFVRVIDTKSFPVKPLK